MCVVVNVEGCVVLFTRIVFSVDIGIVRDWSQPGLYRECGGQ